MDTGSSVGKHETGVQLKRTIGLGTGCSLIIGGVIGSGIFVSPQGVLLGAGSPGLSLIIWALCGLLSLIGALTYAEIGTAIPKSGCAYYPLKEIYGGCIAFVYMFTLTFFILPASTAIVCLTFAEYFLAIFFNDDCGMPPKTVVRVTATTLILLVAAINIRSVAGTGKVSVVFTTAKISALLVIIIGGLVYALQGKSDYLHPDNSFQDTSTDVAGWSEAILSGLWAYAGWDGLNFLVEELKKPEKNLPLAIVISIPTVTIVYILTNMSYFAVLSSNEIASATTVAMTWANVVMSNVSWFVPLAVAVSTFGNLIVSLLLKSRLIYVSAREDHLPSMFSMIHVNFLTPVLAISLVTVFAVVFIQTSTIINLIGYTMFTMWLFHGLLAFGVILLRFTRKDMPRPYKVPLICPIVLLLFSILLTISPLIGNPEWGYFFAVFVIVAGIIFWLLCVKYKFHLPGMGQLTKVVQLYGQVAPSASDEFSEPLETKDHHASSNGTNGSVANRLTPTETEYTTSLTHL